MTEKIRKRIKIPVFAQNRRIKLPFTFGSRLVSTEARIFTSISVQTMVDPVIDRFSFGEPDRGPARQRENSVDARWEEQARAAWEQAWAAAPDVPTSPTAIENAMEIERARQSDVDAADPPFCSGRRGNLAEEASRRAAERIALVPTLEASPPVSEQLISPPAAVRRRPQATACSSLSSAALTVAAIPGYDPRMEVSGGDVSTAFDPALQSHSALQEKLKKVREKFTDIKLQVGYDTQGHAA